MKISTKNLSYLLFLQIMLSLFMGCNGIQLVQTPNVYLNSLENPYSAVPARYQSNEVELLYATDRKPTIENEGTLHYGNLRSRTLAFGSCTVAIGENISWDDIVAASRTKKRSVKLPLQLKDTKELGRYPDPTTPQMLTNGKYVNTAHYLSDLATSEKEMQKIVRQRLSFVERKEVFLFVHGVMNAYDNSAYGMATLWHFLGRPGVPVFYSWPTRRDSKIVRGYNYDRESGEFTVFHLKQFLTTLAATPGLQKIHIIAHSRGTDILTSALRELNIFYTAQGRDSQQELKLGTIILAAADLDLQVAQQRIISERLLQIGEHFIVYFSSTDSVIGMSEWMFGDASNRVGHLQESDIDADRVDGINKQTELQLINVRVSGSEGFMGHTYFIGSPAVLSDLILVLRDNKLPGKQYGRPLLKKESGFWELYDGYPNIPENK